MMFACGLSTTTMTSAEIGLHSQSRCFKAARDIVCVLAHVLMSRGRNDIDLDSRFRMDQPYEMTRCYKMVGICHQFSLPHTIVDGLCFRRGGSVRDWRHEATFGLTVACWKHLGIELTCEWMFLPMGNGSPSLAGFGNNHLATQA